MKKVLLAIVAIASVMMAGVFVPGCVLNLNRKIPVEDAAAMAVPAADAGAAVAVGDVLEQLGRAPLTEALTGYLAPWFWSGVIFAGAGALCAILLGSRKTGIVMMAIGASMTGVGILFAAFPWIVLIAFGGVGILYLAKAIDAWRTEKARAATAADLERNHSALSILVDKVEQVGDKVKAAINSDGPEAKMTVRSAVDPIKLELAEAGKI